MEVGAVKQAFNNELILLKKKLNQARIQIIHKLTRKAKTFVEKKAPEKIKEKLKRKAESAVNEVLILKKIKPKDLARFIVTHKGDLQSYLNKPTVDQDKACARLLLHKSLQDKYKSIRDKFSSIPIEDLLMSREDRKKLKKEEKEKQKNKKKGKGDNKVVNVVGDWDVEDVEPTAEMKSDDEEGITGDEESSNEENLNDLPGNDSDGTEDNDDTAMETNDIPVMDESNDDSEIDAQDDGNSSDSDNREEADKIEKNVRKLEKDAHKPFVLSPKVSETKFEFKPSSKAEKPVKKGKEKTKHDKNKNLKDKLLSGKFKKDVSETPVQETKVVDSFFLTSTGENYMTYVEPRLPDEVKEEHKQGNRKLRRAAMFGHVPKIKPRKDFGPNNRFNGNNSLNKNDSYNKFNNNARESNNDRRNYSDKRNNFSDNMPDPKIEKTEKLHPSWEAKKKQSGILPFQGKKIVFDES